MSFVDQLPTLIGVVIGVVIGAALSFTSTTVTERGQHGGGRPRPTAAVLGATSRTGWSRCPGYLANWPGRRPGPAGPR